MAEVASATAESPVAPEQLNALGWALEMRWSLPAPYLRMLARPLWVLPPHPPRTDVGGRAARSGAWIRKSSTSSPLRFCPLAAPSLTAHW